MDMTSSEHESKLAFEMRAPTMDDVQAIRRMHAQAWLDTYPNDELGVSYDWVKERTDSWLTPEGLQKSRDHFSNVFDNPDHFHRVAVDDDKIVGLVHGLVQDGHKHLGALYLDKKYHGSGLAYKLMDQVNEWFGNDEVDLEVVTYNHRAIAFYEKYGFQATGKENELFGGKMPNTTMTRKGKK
ncbi:MAG TPA: GNAT family N-acetyltransferase [Candidatus Saccharimonadales bacterium]